MWTYLLQSSTALIVLYTLYYALLENLTFFRSNRVFLLFSIITALIIPVLVPVIKLEHESIPVIYWSDLSEVLDITVREKPAGLDIYNLILDGLSAIYFVGVVLIILRMVAGLFRIYKYAINGNISRENGYRLVTTNEVHLPFSFFSYIFISKKVPLSDNLNTVLDHEKIHISNWHTIDIIFVEFVHAFFWFNPIMIFYKRALRQSHEFLADHLICKSFPSKNYIRLLLAGSTSNLEVSLTNHFFNSQIKNRIAMLSKSKSSRTSVWNYTLVVPFVLVLFLFFSSSSGAANFHTRQEISPDNDTVTWFSNPVMLPGLKNIYFGKEVIKVTGKDGKIMSFYTDNDGDMQEFKNMYGPMPKINNGLLHVVDEKPRFPGCEHLADQEQEDCSNNNLVSYVRGHILYPEIVKLKGVSGMCVASFVVTKEGTIKDIKILKTPDPLIGDQVKKAVESMNGNNIKWHPGLKNGEPVNTMLTLPVRFAFEDNKNEDNPSVSSQSAVGHIETIDEMPLFYQTPDMDNFIERVGLSFRLIDNFITSNLTYPEEAKLKRVEGKCIIRLVIDADGNLKDAMIRQDIGFGCGSAALDVIRKMPKWIPGNKNGKPCNTGLELPVVFKLENKTLKEK